MIVTRFAPSPTGYLHIGGARTALFCWLMARHHGGRMILRIEDTDQKRNTPTATRQVMEDLRWLGIQWDEGPEVGGPHGPYLQSQRREIYDIYLKKLLEAGKAYYCFETSEELQAMREEATAEKKTFAYQRPAVFPDEKEAAQARAQGRPVVVRFAMPKEDVVVQDVVRGEVRFPASELGDFIILKSDGFPTYHFACVVDDELMEVTHVIRGQEHLMNTPGHQALQDALGFRRPVYAHISVTVSEGGGKLSKRERAKVLHKTLQERQGVDLAKAAEAGGITPAELQSFLAGDSTPDGPNLTAMAEYLGVHLPEINVVDFFRSGYIPEAMVNFVALLGWNPGDNREIMPLEELAAAFDLERLTKTNSLFDRKKLMAFNMEHMRMLGAEKLLGHFQRYLQVNESPLLAVGEAALAHLLRASEGARTLAEVEQKGLFLVAETVEYDPQAVKKVLQKEGAAELLGQAREALLGLEKWEEAGIHAVIEGLCARHGVGMGKVAQPIRVAITGTTISPPIGDSLILLGKEETAQRIEQTLDFLKNIK
ncbi:MAG: Glutamate--tRNA ligase [Planctomycetes bacterium ADurb.Bin412]|nr:MAG: Glutamate--tRNA ligase [Planctomycetes bacterium ADurb.Bin412]